MGISMRAAKGRCDQSQIRAGSASDGYLYEKSLSLAFIVAINDLRKKYQKMKFIVDTGHSL
ncbi:hypothetical protein K040078D81_15160 [Blautia hominis]|uniref:Uncharacterized protein n=2 Tax=Blautia hominis TaxID=2025493 RepID=A0ABQ0B7G5_9FIRM